MLLTGKCTKCGETIKLDIGAMTKAEAIKLVSKWDEFSCPGHHVELCGPYPHYWNLDQWTMEEGAAESEEDFLSRLKREYREVRDTSGMAGLITGFAMGYPMTNDGRCWNFVSSPKGSRWYVTNDELKQAA